jgi:phosphate:Na+ symporter
MDYTSIIIKFLGSLGLFLFGMSVLSSGLQKTAGCKMKQLLGKMSKTRFRGVLFGTGVTAVIQSSTATTVMAVGFVNAGIISLNQIVGIIMGANIGSTTTSWLVATAEWDWMGFLKPAYLGSMFAAIGAFALLFSKKESVKNVAKVIAGFGVLFIGLAEMPDAVRPLTNLPIVENAFASFGNNPLLALLVGILVTGVIQSSTASIGILQSMAVAGVIPWNAAVFIVLGQNVGTCFTTMLTSIGANRNTRAASFVHFVYNAAGAVIFSIGAFVFFTFINPSFGHEMVTSTNVSMIHTGYNIALLLILFPLGGVILKLAVKMAGGEDVADVDKCELTELDEHILETPEFALENSIKAVVRVTDVLRANLEAAKGLIIEYNPEKATEFWENIDSLDKANSTIRRFLTKLYNEHIGDGEDVSAVVLLQNLTNLQRISNHTKGIVKQVELLEYDGVKYSEKIDSVIREIYEITLGCYDDAIKLLTKESVTREVIERAVKGAETVQAKREEYKKNHVKRVSDGVHDIQSDTMFMEVVRHMSRIVSHCKSIAETAVTEEH